MQKPDSSKQCAQSKLAEETNRRRSTKELRRSCRSHSQQHYHTPQQKSALPCWTRNAAHKQIASSIPFEIHLLLKRPASPESLQELSEWSKQSRNHTASSREDPIVHCAPPIENQTQCCPPVLPIQTMGKRCAIRQDLQRLSACAEHTKRHLQLAQSSKRAAAQSSRRQPRR